MLDPTRRFPEPPPRREPVFNIPPAILGVLAVLAAIHAIRQVIPDSWDEQVLLRLSFLPGTFTYALDPTRVLDALQSLSTQGDKGLRHAQLGRYILLNVGLQPWSLLTYGLLHADWTHIGLNGFWLLAFGSPVARRLGAWRFLGFLSLATLAGAIAHYVTHTVDFQPVIGASAAVSGCMGAALRFMFQPRIPVSAIIGLSEQGRAEAFHQPLLSLPALFRDRRAVGFLLAWCVTNLLFGLGILDLGPVDISVAWQAHIGGFVFGLLLLPPFDRRASAAMRAPHPDAAPDDEAGPADLP